MDYFGEPWPSGVCDDGTRVATPVGQSCLLCVELIAADDRGTFMATTSAERPGLVYLPVHAECSLRSVVGGIGHLEDHAYWCLQRHDPDGGRTFRESALEVWRLHGGG